MYDKELVRDILQQILAVTQKIMQRFERIETVSDFTGSSFGMERMNSICMLPSPIGTLMLMPKKFSGSARSISKKQAEAG
jgi:hypothetical protein